MTFDTQKFGIIILAFTATLVISKTIDSRPEEALAQPLDSIPMNVQDWRGQSDPPLRQDILGALDPSSYLSRTYQRGAESISLFIAYYANQRAGESMHSPKHCLPGVGWEISSYGETDLPVQGRNIRVNHDIIQKDGVRMSVLYWYQSRRRIVADEYRAKLYLIRDAVVEQHTGGAIVRIIYPADTRSMAAGMEFASALFPLLQRSIGGP